MDHANPTCPQCGAPLPRQARWRSVTCRYCAAEVSVGVRLVEAAHFRQAHARAALTAAPHVECAGQRYRVLAPLAMGAHARIVLAETVGAPPARVVLKVAHEDVHEPEAEHGAAARPRREHAVLTQLQDDRSAGAAYFTQRLPQALALGPGAAPGECARATLVLRHPPGLWGSLAALQANYRGGIDGRHLVWMWRRTLDVLGWVHAAGWAHGAIHPGHLLVQPRDHGIVIIGWANARQADGAARARDLRQAAWSMRALLGGCPAGHAPQLPPPLPPALPAPLAALLLRACEADASDGWDAARTDRELQAAAAASFGPPRFIDLPTMPPGAAAAATVTAFST